jgi:hypothetical protein
LNPALFADYCEDYIGIFCPAGIAVKRQCLSTIPRSFTAGNTISFFHPKLDHDHFGRTKLRKTTLQQICADKHGEPQEVFRNEEWAGLNAQGERKQDEAAGHDAYCTISSHDANSFLNAA